MTSNQTANLLDADQIEEIQANVAEALVNIIKVAYSTAITCTHT
jgi:anti-sigma regulatory factor (Ser/Thr protein kinase)